MECPETVLVKNASAMEMCNLQAADSKLTGAEKEREMTEKQAVEQHNKTTKVPMWTKKIISKKPRAQKSFKRPKRSTPAYI